MTGHRCPVWQFRRPDGTGKQARSRSYEGSMRELGEAALEMARKEAKD